MKKSKALATILTTSITLLALTVASFAMEDQAVSSEERRPLEQVPELTSEAVLSGDYMADLETYFLDQFPFRLQFRALKSYLSQDVFGQKDNNNIYFDGNHVFKIEYPLKENQVTYGVNKINEVIATYLKDNKVYFSIVPDKNYFVAEDLGYLHLDYDKMEQMMVEGVNGTYIDIMDLQTIDDYYWTDAHWKQESIFPTAQALAQGMGMEQPLYSVDGFQSHTLEGFEGVYWGQSARPLTPDTLTYVTSPAIDASIMTSLEFKGESSVYTPDKFGTGDSYDVFMAGPQAILTVESPLATTDRELILFRDSYGSSIAPYFLETYSKITLIDLRYAATAYLGQFVEFTDQDVLFLYSTTVLNSAMLLK